MLNIENKAAIITRANDGSESISCQRVQDDRYWRKPINKVIALLSCIAIALPVAATAQTTPESQSRRERGNQVINKLSGGAGQPVLEGLR
jgi:4-carboxymuconolactone decarboxylase